MTFAQRGQGLAFDDLSTQIFVYFATTPSRVEVFDAKCLARFNTETLAVVGVHGRMLRGWAGFCYPLPVALFTFALLSSVTQLGEETSRISTGTMTPTGNWQAVSLQS